MKYTIEIMSSFKKSYKKIKKQNKDLEKIHEVINLLAEGKKLDYKYKDHQLIDDKYLDGGVSWWRHRFFYVLFKVFSCMQSVCCSSL